MKVASATRGPPLRLSDALVLGDVFMTRLTLSQDPDSLSCGKRLKNRWKTSGLPRTFDLDPDLAKLHCENT